MKKGNEVIGIVEKMEFPNVGHVHPLIVTETDKKTGESSTREAEEKDLSVTLTVKNALPGQKVRCRLSSCRHGKAEGRLMEVLERSELEIDSPCPHVPDCGGCLYQTVSYERQLEWKGQQIRDLFTPILGDRFDEIFEGVTPSPTREDYRNKMEFTFGDEYKDGPLALGMHKRGGFYDIVNVDHCRICDGDFQTVMMATLQYFSGIGASYYRRMQHTGYLRHLLVRKAQKTGELLVDLVTSSAKDFAPDLTEQQMLMEWKEVLLEQTYLGRLTGVLHTLNDREADVVEDQGTEILYGRDWFTERLFDLQFQITPFSFFQTNSLGAEVLYGKARDYIREYKADAITGKTVFDLYSGTGTIAQILAPVAGHVVGVEIVEEAVEAARENARTNGLSNCEFIAGDVLKVIDEIKEKPDFIVLDPPRDGIHPKALPKIISYGVEAMIYISCKPTSLVRDLPIFMEAGYQPVRMCCVDMFPNTGNVETVVLLSDKKVDGHIDIDLDVEKLEGKSGTATYAEIKAYIKEKYGFNVTSLYIGQIKDNAGIKNRKNYNTGSAKGRVPACLHMLTVL